MALILAEILGPDMLIILAIVALLFGSKQLPKLARSLGSAKSEFEKGISEGGQVAVSAEAAAPAVTSAPAVDEQVTMSRAELDRLIAEQRERGRGEAPAAT